MIKWIFILNCVVLFIEFIILEYFYSWYYKLGIMNNGLFMGLRESEYFIYYLVLEEVFV